MSEHVITINLLINRQSIYKTFSLVFYRFHRKNCKYQLTIYYISSISTLRFYFNVELDTLKTQCTTSNTVSIELVHRIQLNFLWIFQYLSYKLYSRSKVSSIYLLSSTNTINNPTLTSPAHTHKWFRRPWVCLSGNSKCSPICVWFNVWKMSLNEEKIKLI